LWKAHHGGQDGNNDDAKYYKLLSTFLWQDYSPHAYYYEVLECARRLLLTGAPLFLLDDKHSQIALGLLFCIAATWIVVDHKPYSVSSDSTVAVLAQVVLTLTFFAALLFKTNVPSHDGYNDATFGLMLIFMALFIVAVVAASVGVTMTQRVKSEMARATIIDALDIERKRSGAEYTRATQECNRANAMAVKHTEGKRSQKLAQESMEVELVDMRKQVSVAEGKLGAIEEQEQVAAEIQMQLFEHSLKSYESPFVYMTPAELAAWFVRKIPTVDSAAKPSPKHNTSHGSKMVQWTTHCLKNRS
jgi:hypothetical protein